MVPLFRLVIFITPFLLLIPACERRSNELDSAPAIMDQSLVDHPIDSPVLLKDFHTKDRSVDHMRPIDIPQSSGKNKIIGKINQTKVKKTGTVSIEGIGSFEYKPATIKSVRPDLFQPGYFSLFDILVHLKQGGNIQLTYHFDKALDTHVIDDINGKKNWWYDAYYSGGWKESSVHRMDYYPVKEDMVISFIQKSKKEMDKLHSTWKKQVNRRIKNKGQIIIPEVRINGNKSQFLFKEVLVKPHNLRSDFFVKDTITAMDVIMTLGDMDELTYVIKWYENIGISEIKNFFVDAIDNNVASGHCGFVYEIGEKGESGNHIHVPADIRIMQSPEYVLFFWIQLGPC